MARGTSKDASSGLSARAWSVGVLDTRDALRSRSLRRQRLLGSLCLLLSFGSKFRETLFDHLVPAVLWARIT